MVKNIPTIERSTKVRFGKNTFEDQAENTIVFNASDTAFEVPTSNAVYLSPIRLRPDYDDNNIVLLMYNKLTKEITESGEAATDIIETNLEGATIRGNVIEHSTVYFNNTHHNSFVTSSNIGIINTNPEHTLSIGSNVQIDDKGSNVLMVRGGVSINGSLNVKGDVTWLSSENLKIEDGFIEIGKNNLLADQTHDLGVLMTRPESNVGFGFREGNDEFVIAYTQSSADNPYLVPTSETLNVHVYGQLFTESKVGINTTSTDANLHVVGNVYVSSNLSVDTNTLHVDATKHSIGIETKTPDANLHVVGNVYVSSNLSVDTNTLHVDATKHSIGIETKTPDANLHVVGNVYVSSNLSVDTNTLHVDVENKSIGVGTKYPNSNLHVVGNAYVTSNTIVDGTLTLNHPTTAFITDLTSNVIMKLDQMSNVTLSGLANEDTLIYNGTEWVNQLQNHTFLYCRAEEAISKGEVVYSSGSYEDNIFTIRKARSNNPNTMPGLGIAYQDFALNGEGLVVTFGRAESVNTGGFQTGEVLYVSNTTPGSLSNVKPYALTDVIQNVGLVLKSDATLGIVSVTGVGRANDIPNASVVIDEPAINYVYVNDVNNDFKKIEPSNLLTQLQTLQQVTDTGNTTSNTIQFTNTTTSLITTSNIEVGSNISVSGLVDSVNKHVPMVGLDGFFEKSPIYFTSSGKYVVTSSEAEFLGNLTLSGNTTVLNSESVVIQDRIFGVASNNSADQLDSGFMIEHQDGDPLEYANVALIYHGDEKRFSISYTQNTFTDNHIIHYEDQDHLMLIDLCGNVKVRHNLQIDDALTVANNLSVGAVSNLFVDVNTSRVGVNEPSPQTSLDVNGDVRVQSTTDTSTTTQGSLIVSGGIGVASNIHSTNVFVGTHLGIGTNVATAPLELVVTGTGETTNGIYLKNVTGSALNDTIVNLEVANGGGDPFITWNSQSGSAFAMGLDNSEDLLTISNTSSDLAVNARLRMTTEGEVTLSNVQNSTSKTTGALIVGGGLGVGGEIHSGAISAAKDQNVTSYFGRAAIGYNGTHSDSATFAHVDHNISTNFAIRQTDAGRTILNSAVGERINFNINNSTKASVESNGDFKVDTDTLYVDVGNDRVGINKSNPGFTLDVNGDINFSGSFYEDGNPFISTPWTIESTPTALSYISGNIGIGGVNPSATLEVTGNAHVSSNVTIASTLNVSKDITTTSNLYVTGGLITNTGQVSKKTYSYTGDIQTGTAPDISVVFSDHVFYAKVTAQLIESDIEISTLTIDLSGGRRGGASSSTLNIAKGPLVIFGDTTSKPWDTTVTTDTTTLTITPSSGLSSPGGYYNIFIEYMSSDSGGKVSEITEAGVNQITFTY